RYADGRPRPRSRQRGDRRRARDARDHDGAGHGRLGGAARARRGPRRGARTARAGAVPRPPAPLTVARDALAWLAPRADAYLELLGDLVAADDVPSCRDALVGRLGTPASDAAGHLLYGAGPGPLLSCHYDTVWPAGVAATRPMTVRDGCAYGPGTADMKGGIAVAIAAVEALAEVAPEAAWRLSLTPDEEVGNRGTRDAI